MSFSVYVNGWNEQPSSEVKVFLCETYPLLSEADFEGYQCDDLGRHYEMQTVYKDPFPVMNMNYGNWADLSQSLGMSTVHGIGELKAEEISHAIHQCMLFINSDDRINKTVREGSNHKNVICPGTSNSYLRGKAEELMGILKFARDRNTGVYWG